MSEPQGGEIFVVTGEVKWALKSVKGGCGNQRGVSGVGSVDQGRIIGEVGQLGGALTIDVTAIRSGISFDMIGRVEIINPEFCLIVD